MTWVTITGGAFSYRSDHNGATLAPVAGPDNARTKRQAATEILGLHVFGIADTGGKLITRRLVADRLSELAAHRSECRCGLCGLLPLTTTARVWRTASRWQGDINQMRMAARR